MQIVSLKVKNFRSFKDEQHINFSGNVTVIHGENGVGKSNLLYAIIWCLYGPTALDNTPIANDINNLRHKESSDCLVAIRVKKENVQYEFQRTFKASLKVYKVEDDGSLVPRPRPEAFVRYFLPQDLYPFFFFDGEHADDIVKPNTKLKFAMEKIFGFHHMDTAVRYLTDIKAEFTRAESKHQKNQKDLETYDKGLNRFTDKLHTQKEQQNKIENAIKTIKSKIDVIDKKLRNYGAVKQLQETRDEIQRSRDAYNKQYKDNKNRAFKEFYANISLILASDIIADVKYSQDDDGNQTTESLLPYPWGPDLINKILKEEKCICDTPLCDGSVEKEVIESLIPLAVPDWQKYRERDLTEIISNVKQQFKPCKSNIKENRKLYRDAHKEYSKSKDRLNEISKEIEEKDISSVSILEQERRKLEEKWKTENGKLLKLKCDIPQTEQDIQSYKAKIKKIEDQTMQQGNSGYALKIESLRTAIEWIEETKKEEFTQAYDFIQESIRKTCVDDLGDNWQIELDKENWTPHFQNESGKPIPEPSTGQKKIAGLSISTAITHFSHNVKENPKFQILQGSEAPLILDSIFGDLDKANRKLALDLLLENSNQIVFFTSSSQGGPQFIEQIKQKGHQLKQYYIQAYRKGSVADKILTIDNQDLTLVKHNQNAEYSIIKTIGDT